MPNVFAVPLFFILFRETLETSIIVAVLLAFLKRNLGSDNDLETYKKLRRQVWYGTSVGFAICFIIGCGVIGAFYGLGKNAWAGTEKIWEGVFAIIASIIISVMGAALLRVSKLQDKWKSKLAKALEAKDSVKNQHGRRSKFKMWCEKYAMFILPFITILREGLEAVIFAGGVSLGYPASSFPLPIITGILAGSAVGFLIYKGGNRASLQVFLIISTCFLYLVAAGLFSRAVWMFEINTWDKAVGGDGSETGSGAGSYDIRQSVWHVNCCNPDINGGGGWGIFSHVIGWQNSATYGSVIAYNLYWLVVIVGFLTMGYREKRGGWPLTTKSTHQSTSSESVGGSEGQISIASAREAKKNGGAVNTAIKAV